MVNFVANVNLPFFFLPLNINLLFLSSSLDDISILVSSIIA